MLMMMMVVVEPFAKSTRQTTRSTLTTAGPLIEVDTSGSVDVGRVAELIRRNFAN